MLIPTSTVCERRKGRGAYHFILVPGLVPDGPFTFMFQQRMLTRFGHVTTITYPYTRFAIDETLGVIRGEIDDAIAGGRKPVLVGVSVGGGLSLELLRRTREAGAELPLAGLLLISPLSCESDLAALLKRLMTPIMNEYEKQDGTPEKALQRGREFFMSLAAKSAGPKRSGGGLSQFFQLLTPAGIIAYRDAKIRERIERSLNKITDLAAVQRVVAIRQFRGVHDLAKSLLPAATCPVMVLWGSKERHTLDMNGPGTSLLCRPDLAFRHFPNLEVQWVYNPDGEEAPHASLMKHSSAFNRHIQRFCKRLGAVRQASDD